MAERTATSSVSAASALRKTSTPARKLPALQRASPCSARVRQSSCWESMECVFVWPFTVHWLFSGIKKKKQTKSTPDELVQSLSGIVLDCEKWAKNWKWSWTAGLQTNVEGDDRSRKSHLRELRFFHAGGRLHLFPWSAQRGVWRRGVWPIGSTYYIPQCVTPPFNWTAANKRVSFLFEIFHWFVGSFSVLYCHKIWKDEGLNGQRNFALLFTSWWAH